MARKKNPSIEELTKKRKKSDASQTKINNGSTRFPKEDNTQSRKTRIKTKVQKAAKPKKPKKLTPTQKLRRNVQATIRRAEKRGYRFDDKLKSKIKNAPYQTLKSYQSNKYSKLYKESTAIDPATGNIISGTKYLYIERAKAGKKAAETRRRRKAEAEQPYREEMASKPVASQFENQPDVFENEEIAYEEELQRVNEFNRLKNNADYRADLQQGDMMLDNIYDLIQQFESQGAGMTGVHFKNLITEYIDKYGKDAIMYALSQVPSDYYEQAQSLVFYGRDAERLSRAIRAFTKVIDTGLQLTGLDPLHPTDETLEEILEADTSPFNEEEYYPY